VTKQWVRREPSSFGPVEVARRAPRTPHLLRVTFAGPGLAGFDPGLPAASVRLLVPSPGGPGLVLPEWNGNEFLLPDGSRPVIRTYTPLRYDPDALELDLDIVLHPDGAVAAWAQQAQPGAPAAISGTGRGYTVDPEAPSFVLAGDEAALPAIGQLIDVLPQQVPVRVLVEVARPDARLELPAHAGLTATWHDLPAGGRAGDALVAAVQAAEIPPDARVWAAGEAAAVQRIRKHLFEERGLSREQATIRGYWKHGRTGD
jgi:NADPH-dependent ferric siderophore reductase